MEKDLKLSAHCDSLRKVSVNLECLKYDLKGIYDEIISNVSASVELICLPHRKSQMKS